MAAKRLHVVALGCPKNRVDVETIVALASVEGFRLVEDPARADVILVGTCGFVEAAAVESIEAVVALGAARKRGARLVVAGCLAQRYGEDLARALPEASALVGTSDLGQVVDAVAGRGPRVRIGLAGADLATSAARQPSLHPGSAYLKVADGCSRTCAFCTIPSIRGPFRSRPVAELCDEAADLARRGVLELNLVAQDLSSYGRDRSGGESLVDLLAGLSRIDRLRWIRPLYLYPGRTLGRVLAAISSLKRLVPYLDLPVQHGSGRVLRRMKRGAGAAATRRLISGARKAIPGLWLRSTLIVGHPGEGEDDVSTLLDLVEWARFDHLGVFRWSAEEGTESAAQPGAPSRRVGYDRHRRVLAVQRRISRARCRTMRGRLLDVLVEGPRDETPRVYVGRHAGQAPEVDGKVYLDRPAAPGTIVSVRVTKTGDYDLFGEVVEPGSVTATGRSPRCPAPALAARRAGPRR